MADSQHRAQQGKHNLNKTKTNYGHQLGWDKWGSLKCGEENPFYIEIPCTIICWCSCLASYLAFPSIWNQCSIRSNKGHLQIPQSFILKLLLCSYQHSCSFQFFSCKTAHQFISIDTFLEAAMLTSPFEPPREDMNQNWQGHDLLVGQHEHDRTAPLHDHSSNKDHRSYLSRHNRSQPDDTFMNCWATTKLNNTIKVLDLEVGDRLEQYFWLTLGRALQESHERVKQKNNRRRLRRSSQD